MQLNQQCRDAIVQFEIGSTSYYNRFAQFPSWPGGNSGVTIGIGYDLGQHTHTEFVADWRGKIAATTLLSLGDLVGLRGEDAHRALQNVGPRYYIPLSVATSVFDEVMLPRYVAMLLRAIPETASLPENCFGALVDLVFNRGADFSSGDPRRSEMAAIKDSIQSGKLDRIPGLIRRMKRLWPNSHALLNRREWEASVFELALEKSLEQPTPVQRQPPVEAPADEVISEADVLNQAELDRIRGDRRWSA